MLQFYYSISEYPYTEDGSLSEEPADVVSYEYANEWKDQLTSYDGKEITYDENGNPLSYRDKTLTWQGRNLATLTEGETSISCSYNSDGLRTKKVNGSETSQYYYSGSKLVYETRGNKELYYMYDASGALARINYYKNDALVGTYYVATTSRGDVEAIYNYLGEVRARYTYDSWGNVISVVDGEGALIPEENADHIGHVNPFRYRGYYYDAETGFYYVSLRYYDPDVGRFISADKADILTAFPTSVGGKNLFVYANNNPVNLADSGGLFAVPAKLINGAIMVGINVASSWAAAKATGQEYTLVDALTTGASTAISLALEDYMFTGALINGVISAVSTGVDGGNAIDAFKAGVSSVVSSYVSISGLVSLSDIFPNDITTYAIEATFGFGANLTSNAIDMATNLNTNKKMSNTNKVKGKNTTTKKVDYSRPKRLYDNHVNNKLKYLYDSSL